MTLKYIFLLAQIFCFLALAAQVRIQNPRIENLSNPIGLDITQPRFGWQFAADRRNVLQTAYEIRVAMNATDLLTGKKLFWTSGKTQSDASVWVPYTGPALVSGKKYWWQVRVWDNAGNVSDWSQPNFWQMGLLNPTDWKAKWISLAAPEDSTQPSPMFRKEFATKKKIVSATAYITAHGLYEAQINGQRVGQDYLTPGWTVYNKRLQYQAYDVTNLLQKGSNAIGVTLGSGWWRGNIGWAHVNGFYGKDISLIFQLEIQYTDGSNETVASDDSWKYAANGPIQSSEIYHGETYDARLEQVGWSSPGYNVSKWSTVSVKDFPKDNLIGTYNEPIQKHETFRPVKIFRTPQGELVADFGQNLVGWVELKARGNSGDRVVLQFAEVLDKQSNFYTDNLRAAKCTDTWILKGSGEEHFEPHFTFHGFRYAKITGYPGELKPENITAVALYSAMRPAGSFSSSDPLVNQLQHNIQWGQRGNFLDVPTDCPQRDERLGWTGDAQAFSRTATFNFDAHNFFAKWLKDMAADQQSDGMVPWVIPNVLRARNGASAGWADAATIIPWNMWLAYGDRRILEDQYPSMKAWVEYMRKESKNDLWNTGPHFGDWLFYSVTDDNDGRSAITDKYLIAQCFYAHSTQLLINAAQVLGKKDEVAVYSELLKKVKTAYLNEYVTPNGRPLSPTQTAYVLALQFDLLPENQREQAAKNLAENIKNYKDHLTTGFLGTPYLCHVLTRFGYNDLAYTLLNQKTYPSWLYPVTRGATTIWERWDGIRPDSSFQAVTMNSFNHYAYGAIGDWMYRVMAGLDTETDAPGYKAIRIQPRPGGGFTEAAATLQTLYGQTSSRWQQNGKSLTLDVEIPANTTATVFVPTSEVSAITESGKPLKSLPEIRIEGAQNGFVVLKMGSGKYLFSVTN
ncbi:MAG: glycoside hydrolase family 78 protein [Phycisphaerae bacterium]|nr:glycoside hydrolase family 78 protein [Saprospiraceae bacterium]